MSDNREHSETSPAVVNGRLLKEKRLERLLTQKEMAKSVGISLRTYQALENEERSVNQATLKKIANNLELGLSNLVRSESGEQEVAYSTQISTVMESITEDTDPRELFKLLKQLAMLLPDQRLMLNATDGTVETPHTAIPSGSTQPQPDRAKQKSIELKDGVIPFQLPKCDLPKTSEEASSLQDEVSNIDYSYLREKAKEQGFL